MAWSGGKDSAMALYRLQQDDRYEVKGLLTTLSRRFDRISIHGVRRLLLEAQAESLGLKVFRVWLPDYPDNATYEAEMGKTLEVLKAEGVDAVAFGDLYLEDIRTYRERMMAQTGITPLFPLWGQPTEQLAGEIIDLGFKATLVCVDPQRNMGPFLGKRFDAETLGALPEDIDPCGENGEFHTFVHDGPNFRHPISTVLGTQIEKEGFLFVDLLPHAKKKSHTG